MILQIPALRGLGCPEMGWQVCDLLDLVFGKSAGGPFNMMDLADIDGIAMEQTPEVQEGQ